MADRTRREGSPWQIPERLEEGLRKFINISPESAEGEKILKDKFLTQSAPDIDRKLQKQAFGPNQPLEKLLQLTQTVYYSRGYEKKQKTEKNQRKGPGPVMAVKTAMNQPESTMPRGTQVKRDGLAITVKRRGISSKVVLRYLSHPQLPVQSIKYHMGGETALKGIRPRGWTLRIIRTEGAWGSPQKLPS